MIIWVCLSAANYPVHALEGNQDWAFEALASVDSSPAIGVDGTIYVGSDDGKLYAINSNGTQKWAFTTGTMVESSPAIDTDGIIYVGSMNGNLYAINPNGTQKWVFPTGDQEVESSPAIGSDGTIYIGTIDYQGTPGTSDSGNLFAVNPNGSQKWVFPDISLAPNGYLIIFASVKTKLYQIMSCILILK